MCATWRCKIRPVDRLISFDPEGLAKGVPRGKIRGGSATCIRWCQSRRKAARVFGPSRDMVDKMCRYAAPPGYTRTRPPIKPKLDPLLPVIDAILAADKSAPPKQRHTAKRIFERLRAEHG